MKKLLLCLFLLITGIFPAAAQESYTWERYNLSLTLPDGWAAEERGDRLFLGTPEDLAAALANTPAAGLVVTIEETLPEDDAEGTFEQYTQGVTRGLNDTDMMIGIPYPAASVDTGERGALMVLVGERFLLVFSAAEPLNTYSETILALLDSITVTTPPLDTAASLIPFEWHGLRVSIPDHWQVSSAASKNMLILSTFYDRLYFSSRFSHNNLSLVLVDYSHLRPFLTPESVGALSGFYYRPDNATLGDLTTESADDVAIASIPFASGELDSGEARLYLTAEHAYLLVGIAGNEQWEASEQALFDTISASVEITGQ